MRLLFPFLALALTVNANAQLNSSPLVAPTPKIRTLKETVAKIARETDATVSVACALPGKDLDCGLNADNHPPMQSVFKLPLAITVLHLVEQGKLSLDQQIR